MNDRDTMSTTQQRVAQCGHQPTPFKRRRFGAHKVVPTLLLTVHLASHTLSAADITETGEKAQEALRETSVAVETAATSAADSAKELWRRIDEQRLANRTRDEIVAWIIIGMLVGAMAGMMTKLKPTGVGKAGRLLLGLAGAFFGGMVVHVANVNFGWGPVLIRYEELFFSLVGAILIVLAGRMVRSRAAKKRPGG